MMAKVKEVYSSDIDVRKYVADNPIDDAQWIRFLVGPSNSEGSESFDVLICTAAWISRMVGVHGPTLGTFHLILDHMDLALAIGYLTKRIESVGGSDWGEVAEKVSKIGHWEFQDYQEI